MPRWTSWWRALRPGRRKHSYYDTQLSMRAHRHDGDISRAIDMTALTEEALRTILKTETNEDRRAAAQKELQARNLPLL